MNIVHILDKIRDEKKMSISFLCEDVCSRKSYYLYRDENKKIPGNTLELLCNKLNITVKELYLQYQERLNPLYSDIYELLFTIQKGDIKKSKQLLDQIDPDFIESPIYTHIYEYSLTKYQFYTQTFRSDTYYEKLKSLLQLERLELSSYSNLDFIILFELASIEVREKSHDYFYTNILSNSLLNIKITSISNDTIHMILPIFDLIAKHENKMGNEKHALELCYKGIELSQKFYSYISIRNFFYLIGLISIKIEDWESAEENFMKCLYTIVVKDNKEMFDTFKGFIITMLSNHNQEKIIEKINSVIYYE
ncbi:MAG: helix-turn-helix domain-containing protein [Candidatus Izemoplasmatales bacterium]